jgi:alkylation response protein AidB-like acyl-CoA dehydrogenase
VELQLTEDQVLFDDTTARFLESSCPVATVREWADKEPAGFPLEWWRRGAELGWTSLLVGEEDGGGSISGHGLLDLVLVAEEMGRRVSPGPLVPANLVASALADSGSAEHRRSILSGIMSGEVIAAWCQAEPGVPWSSGPQLRASVTDGGLVLDGVKGPVEAGAEADWLLVTASVDGAPTHVMVEANTPGVIVAPAGSLDLVRRFASITFAGVEVPASAVVGEIGDAAGEIDRLIELAVVLQCAEMAGAVDRMLEVTLEYAFDRYSFGRPLASYQALKHRFADLKLWVEACLATAQAAATAVDRRSDRAGELVSAAKSYIGDHAPAVLQDCVQLQGGIGVTWDHDLHLYLRRVVQDAVLYGTPADHRERIADQLGLGRAGGDHRG